MLRRVPATGSTALGERPPREVPATGSTTLGERPCEVPAAGSTPCLYVLGELTRGALGLVTTIALGAFCIACALSEFDEPVECWRGLSE